MALWLKAASEEPDIIDTMEETDFGKPNPDLNPSSPDYKKRRDIYTYYARNKNDFPSHLPAPKDLKQIFKEHQLQPNGRYLPTKRNVLQGSSVDKWNKYVEDYGKYEQLLKKHKNNKELAYKEFYGVE